MAEIVARIILLQVFLSQLIPNIASNSENFIATFLTCFLSWLETRKLFIKTITFINYL